MDKEKKKLDYAQSMILKNNAVRKLDFFLQDLINEGDSKQSKAEKLSYWLSDWVDYLQKETSFEAEKLVRYKRGSIIKVHLGFNVGSEEGGLHYAIVIDKDNKLKNPLLTIIPLTSLKSEEKLQKLPNDQLYLGDELYRLLKSKLDKKLEKLSNFDFTEASNKEIINFEKELSSAKKIKSEIGKMKSGSIALIGQLTTISKLRIYDPKNKYDVLNNIRLSPDTLDKLDSKIKEKFFKKT